jgi:hypothetical protein
VPAAAVHEDLLGARDARVVVGGAVHRQQRAQLLAAQRLGGPHLVDLGDQHARALGHALEAKHLAERRDGLADDAGVEAAGAVDDRRARAVLLVGALDKVRAAAHELGAHGVVHRVLDDDCLLARADHAVVKRLGQHDRRHRHLQVGGRVDDGRRVAGADAERRVAARVGGVHERGPAGREHERRLRRAHRRLRQRE